MNKTEVITICENFNLAPNKKFGQNFLTDNNIINKINDAVSSAGADSLLEIGPGLGALTEIFIKKYKYFTAVEIDSGLVKYLAGRFGDYENFSLIHGDFLKVDLKKKFDTIVSNLPYSCASEILFKLARDFEAEKIFIMIQKELADRMVSLPGDKSYGAFTVTLNYYFKPEKLFKITGNAFYPRPDVSSSFLKLARKKIVHTINEIDIFHSVVKSAFWGRRKKIARSLSDSPHMDLSQDKIKYILQKAGVNEYLRAEDLSVNEFIEIALLISELE